MMDNKDIDFDKKHIHFYDADIPNLLKKAIESKIKEEFNIVDLGCGDGKLLFSLQANNLLKNSRKIVGIDKSPIRIEKFKKILPQSESFVSDVCSLDILEKESFDIVVSSQVIEHVSDDDQMLKEIWRLLKPDGIAYVSSVIKKKYGLYIYRVDGKIRLDPTHVREYSSGEEFSNLIKKNKFNILDIEIKPIRYPLIELLTRLLIRIGIVSESSIQKMYIEKKWMKITKKINVPIIGYRSIEVLCKK